MNEKLPDAIEARRTLIGGYYIILPLGKSIELSSLYDLKEWISQEKSASEWLRNAFNEKKDVHMYMDLSQLFQDYINFHSELENLVSSLPQEENGRPESRQHVKSVKRDIEDLCAKLSAAGYVRMQSPAALFARWLATDATQVGTWRWKSSADPARGTASRTARVSIARWNLKEAAGKALA